MSIPDFCPDFLPGAFRLAAATASDYQTLERFHYLPRRPATWAAVRGVWYAPPAGPDRLVAVAVLSHPPAVHRVRHRVFGLVESSYGEKLRWANANLRTISRVIVHPQFRALGLARRLIEDCVDQCPTRYVEAAARMGRCHPMFAAAGMTRVDPGPGEAVYYWIDKQPALGRGP